MRRFYLLLASSLLLLGFGCQSPSSNDVTKTEPTTLTLYTYESLAADYGLLPKILSQFEQTNNVTVEVVSFADTGTMLNQLIQEKDAPKADVVMGLDNVDFVQANATALLQSYQPQRAAELAPDLWFDDNYSMTPFDYGYVGFVYDSEAIQFPEAISLADLATSTYKNKIIIEQAGLSSPGTQLMIWANAALGTEGAKTFWDNLADTVLTVAPDWSTAYYSQFLEGEAPIVLSYLTSPAYHIDQESTERYKAIPIKEGYLRQVEGIGVVAGADQTAEAQAFIDYILSDDVQNQIPTTQWMFPVLGDPAALPAAYSKIIVPQADEILTVSTNKLGTNYGNWLADWNEAFGL